jgi:trans-aconitate methyltransferase
MTIERALAGSFEDDDVARCYVHRPPYAPGLLDLLVAVAPATHRALDLGCGPGKIAHLLAERFDDVHAVDPSAAMIAVARERPSRIRWEQASAESAELVGPYDLVTLGTSAHWMDHAVVFPRLRAHVSEGGVVAFVEGDEVHRSAWDEAWKALIERWLVRVGVQPDPEGYRRDLQAHEAWVDVQGRRALRFEHAQELEHFVELQHSRATWARSRMGPLADAMDAEMRAVLAPHAVDGVLRYQVETRVVWGLPRAQPRA